ncbi:hypothetical protein H7J86_05490 [Mycobacterium hackensackense]|uniref:phage holin family protein n=1 Tax=Mycobacterium hackensackense TaxID=228909 RepID=UPI0022657F69|nr:phage holin family protein [Mycobacterium hackensackense]MCV7251609.1 hypothetical protein [Mycobacterium hackensackense]
MSQRKRLGVAAGVALVFATFALIFGVIAFVQWGQLRERQMNANWGSVPDWIAGVGTTLAFAIAAYVFWYETRARNFSERRSQAGAITAWPSGYRAIYKQPRDIPADVGTAEFIMNIISPGPVSGRDVNLTTTMQVNLINASSSAIYDLIVVVLCEHSDAPMPATMNDFGESQLVQTVLEPWEHRLDRIAIGRASVLPPGKWQVRVKLASTSVRGEGVNLFFRDSHGNHWHRASLGQLVELHSGLPDENKALQLAIADEVGERGTDARLRVIIPKPLTDEEST